MIPPSCFHLYVASVARIIKVCFYFVCIAPTPTSKFPLIVVSPAGLIDRPLLPPDFMTNPFELKTQFHHEVVDALVQDSNKQPLHRWYKFLRKPAPLLLVLLIIRGIVSDYVGCLCEYETLRIDVSL